MMTPCWLTAATASGMASRMADDSSVSATFFWLDCKSLTESDNVPPHTSTSSQFKCCFMIMRSPAGGKVLISCAVKVGVRCEKTASSQADERLLHVPEAVRHHDRNQHLRSVVADVYQETRSHRMSHGPHEPADYAHNKDDQQRTPGIAVLRHMHRGKGQRSQKDSPARAPTSGQHGIEKSAKE